jgi:hypothetical protein
LFISRIGHSLGDRRRAKPVQCEIRILKRDAISFPRRSATALRLSIFGQRADNLVQQRQRVVGPVRFALFKIVARLSHRVGYMGKTE